MKYPVLLAAVALLAVHEVRPASAAPAAGSRLLSNKLSEQKAWVQSAGQGRADGAAATEQLVVRFER